FTLTALAGLLFGLIPAWGLNGAALAVAIAYISTNLLQWWQAARVTGVNPYRAEVGQTLGLALAAIAALLLARFALSGVPEAVQRGAAFAAFMVVGATGYFGWLRRKAT